MSILPSENFAEWLGLKIPDPYTENIYDPPNIPLSDYSGSNPPSKFYSYYTGPNDPDVVNTLSVIPKIKALADEYKACKRYSRDFAPTISDEELQELSDLSQYLETYGDNSILLAPSSNQAHTSYLFKRLIDESEQMIYNVPMITNDGYETKQMKVLDPTLKIIFYKFCHYFRRNQ